MRRPRAAGTYRPIGWILRVAFATAAASGLAGCNDFVEDAEPVPESHYVVETETGAVYFRTSTESEFLQPGTGGGVDELVADADAETFEIIPYYEDDPSHWARDGETVWVSGKPIEGADPSTFTFLDGLKYARDTDQVWRITSIYGGYATAPIPGADPDTFTPLGAGHSRDATTLWYLETPIDGIDVAAAQVDQLGATPEDGALAWDDGQLWHNGEPVTIRYHDGTTGSFDASSLDGDHYRSEFVLADADGVYAMLVQDRTAPPVYYRLDIIDPGTFDRLEDRDHTIKFNIVPAEPSFRPRTNVFNIFELADDADVESLGCGYVRYGEEIFYHGVLVADTPAASFSPKDAADNCRSESWFLEAVG